MGKPPVNLAFIGNRDSIAAQRSDTLLATQTLQHDADLFLRRMMLARPSADIFDDSIGRWLVGSSFPSHLHSLTVQMSQKPSVMQIL